jgi:hypothetical protein
MEGNPCSICWENIRTNACILNKKRMLLKDGCTILSMGLVWKRRLIDPNVLQHYLNTLHIINSIWTLYIWRHFKIIIHLERKFTRECKTCKKSFYWTKRENIQWSTLLMIHLLKHQMYFARLNAIKRAINSYYV